MRIICNPYYWNNEKSDQIFSVAWILGYYLMKKRNQLVIFMEVKIIQWQNFLFSFI
jgi:hypothetical protein